MARSKYHELRVPQSADLPRSLAGMECVSDHVGSDGLRHLFFIRNEDREQPGAQPKPRPQGQRKARKPRATMTAMRQTPDAMPSAATAFPGAEVKGA